MNSLSSIMAFYDEVAQRFNRDSITKYRESGAGYVWCGRCSEHFAERLLERILPDDRDEVLTCIFRYIRTHHQRIEDAGLQSDNIGKKWNIKVQNTKWAVVLSVKGPAGASTDPRHRHQARPIVHMRTVWSKDDPKGENE